jgi:hypothetical protein
LVQKRPPKYIMFRKNIFFLHCFGSLSFKKFGTSQILQKQKKIDGKVTQFCVSLKMLRLFLLSKLLSYSWTKVAPTRLFQLSSCIGKSAVSDFQIFQNILFNWDITFELNYSSSSFKNCLQRLGKLLISNFGFLILS